MNRYQRLVELAAELIARGSDAREKRKRVEQIVAAARADRKRRPPRKPPEAGIPVPAVLPKGPLPKQGGAEAPLTFD